MLFRKKLERSCDYCIHSTQLSDGSILCAGKGLIMPTKACRKFRYDPTRRIPRKMKTPDFSKFDEEDFSL